MMPSRWAEPLIPHCHHLNHLQAGLCDLSALTAREHPHTQARRRALAAATMQRAERLRGYDGMPTACSRRPPSVVDRTCLKQESEPCEFEVSARCASDGAVKEGARSIVALRGTSMD